MLIVPDMLFVTLAVRNAIIKIICKLDTDSPAEAMPFFMNLI